MGGPLGRAIAVGPAFADDADLLRTNPRFAAAFAPVAAAAKKSIVRITCDGEDCALGVILDADGLILTKANDLHGTLRVRLADDSLHDAKQVATHRPHDLALLKIDAHKLQPIAFAPSKQTAAGTWVVAPLPSGAVAGFGVVSVLACRCPLYKGPVDDPGNSPYLGVALEGVEGGVRVTSIVPGTPAEKVGLMAGDVIHGVGGTEITGYDDFVAALAKYRPGNSVELKTRRAETEAIVSVILESRPLGSFRGEMQNRMGSELSSRRTGFSTILQHDAVIRPSDCGGPLVDLDGHVLGLNICRAGRTESWALPTEAINAVLPELRRQATKASR